ncbi:MAG: hypothetical protein EBR82_39170 [Caulobacteraceae bacterium]|nr:hypothetical protein [Caulobacteraceae bacterium]
MKGPTIMIGLLGSEPEMVEKEGLLEDGECPLATQDEIVNRGNKQVAVLKANYGPAEGEEKCGNCEYGMPMNKCGVTDKEVYCVMWDFKCKKSGVCDAWEPNESSESD